MITNILDKILFGVLLLMAFQVPIIADQYLQFVSGYYQSTKNQVEGYSENAIKHEYANVYAMIADFRKNSNSAVRADGEQKLRVMKEFEELKKAMSTLKAGNIFEKAWFMFNPSRWQSLKKVMENFRPSIPLAITDIIYSGILAMILSLLIMWPIRSFIGRRKSA